MCAGGIENGNEIIKQHQQFILEFLGKEDFPAKIYTELKIRHSNICPISHNHLDFDRRCALYRLGRKLLCECTRQLHGNYTATKRTEIVNLAFTGNLSIRCQRTFRAYADYLQSALQSLLAVFVSFFYFPFLFICSTNFLKNYSATTKTVSTLATHSLIGTTISWWGKVEYTNYFALRLPNSVTSAYRVKVIFMPGVHCDSNFSGSIDHRYHNERAQFSRKYHEFAGRNDQTR